MKQAMDKLDLLVVIDPFPSATAAMAAMPGKPEDLNPNRAVYLLPARTQFETIGSVHGVEPLAAVAREGDRAAVGDPHRPHDHVPACAQKLGFDNELVKNYQDRRRTRAAWTSRVTEDHPARDQPQACWTIGYTGQ